MMVRTYGRRNRGVTRSYSDNVNDTVLDPLSQDDMYSLPFASQESSSRFSSFDFESYGQNSSSQDDPPNDAAAAGAAAKKRKKAKQNLPPRGDGKSKKEKSLLGFSRVSTATLMEAQESGEMMEHVDEVNFALDGLRKGQPVRIRRASLLSLLGICGTSAQRRLLRTQG